MKIEKELICTRCKEVKDIGNFNPTKYGRKYSAWCRSCFRDYSAEKRGPRKFQKTYLFGNLKMCAVCEEFQPTSDFYKAKCGSGGISSYCKKCYKHKFPSSRYYRKEKAVCAPCFVEML